MTKADLPGPHHIQYKHSDYVYNQKVIFLPQFEAE